MITTISVIENKDEQTVRITLNDKDIVNMITTDNRTSEHFLNIKWAKAKAFDEACKQTFEGNTVKVNFHSF